MGSDIGDQWYMMVPRWAYALEIVAVVGGVVTGVLWYCRKLVPNLMYLWGARLWGEILGLRVIWCFSDRLLLLEIVAVVGGVATGVLWFCRKLVPSLISLWGPTLFGARYWGSKVCDGSAQGFCYRNSGSSNVGWLLVYCSSAGNWCLALCTFEFQRFFGARYWGSEVCDGSALGFCYRNNGSGMCTSYWCTVVVQEIGA